jgi:alpha-D-xyloside xylohydrolase
VTAWTVLAVAFLAGAGCGDDGATVAVPLVSGDASLTLSPNGTTLTLARAGETRLVFADDAFAVGTVDDASGDASFDPYFLFADAPPAPPPGFAWWQPAPGDGFVVRASSAEQLVLGVPTSGADAELTFAPTAAGSFSLVMHATGRGGRQVAYFRVRGQTTADDAFYGLGEWGDAVEHRGKLRPMQLELDTSFETSNNEAHAPVPLVLGTRGWGMFVKSDRPGVFDLGRMTPDVVDVTFGTGPASADGLEVHVFTAAAPLDLLKPYHDLTGAAGLPAAWAYGPLMWRDENASQAQVLADIQELRTRHLPASGMWFDRPYASGVETFDFSPQKFPDPPAMLAALHDAGLRYALWQAPYTAPAGNAQDPAPAQQAEALANGYFPPVTGILVNHWSAPIDFTNPAAYAWWQGNLRKYTADLGVEGFKLDYAEDVVVGALGNRTPWRFADGSDERTMHRGYQLLYHRVHRELLPADGGFLLTRTGRWGDQVTGAILWPGDLDATFAHRGDPIAGQSTRSVGGLPAALACGLSLSASGFPFYASDTGGYRQSPASDEVWLRWVEANSVWSAMQVGDSSSFQPWENRDAATLAIYQRYASLHLRLFPYAWSYAHAMATTGRPIVRPFGLAYPEVGQHPSDEYAFGDDLLVAPVIEPGVAAREVWFPAGEWLDWWTGTPYAGGMKHVVPADLATLPLFVRRGGIVPMLRDTIETLAPVAAGSTVDSFAADPGTLWVRVVPGTPRSTFEVYDGTRLAQEVGILGFTPGSVFTTSVVFESIATPLPASVRSGGTVLAQVADVAALATVQAGWFWEPARGGTLWIKLTGASTVTVQ